MLLRRRKNVIAEFSEFSVPPTYGEVSLALGRMLIQEYMEGGVDQVYVAYTDFTSMTRQTPVVQKLIPLAVDTQESHRGSYNYAEQTKSVFYLRA